MPGRRPIVGVMGAADAAPERVRQAEALGEQLAQRGWIVLTGGRPFGIMEAACRGAKRVAGSLTIGILPTAAEEPSPWVDIAIRTDLGHARNNVNVLTSDVVIACGVEGPGTTSEVALAIKNGRPVILLAADDAVLQFFTRMSASRFRVAADVEEVLMLVEELLRTA